MCACGHESSWSALELSSSRWLTWLSWERWLEVDINGREPCFPNELIVNDTLHFICVCYILYCVCTVWSTRNKQETALLATDSAAALWNDVRPSNKSIFYYRMISIRSISKLCSTSTCIGYDCSSLVSRLIISNGGFQMKSSSLVCNISQPLFLPSPGRPWAPVPLRLPLHCCMLQRSRCVCTHIPKQPQLPAWPEEHTVTEHFLTLEETWRGGAPFVPALARSSTCRGRPWASSGPSRGSRTRSWSRSEDLVEPRRRQGETCVKLDLSHGD